MKKMMYILLCCIFFTGCTNHPIESNEFIAGHPIPARLLNGTYMPVENKKLSETLSTREILPTDLNENGVVILENEVEAYEIAVSLFQIRHPGYLKEPFEFGIAYKEDLGVYVIMFVPADAALGGDINYIIKNTGEVLSIEYGE